MDSIFQAVRVLRDKGKLHKSLITRVRMLFGISVVLAGVALYNVFVRDINPLLALGLAATGFIFGFFLFSRMNKLTWDEQQETIRAGRMDVVGFAVLGLYIVFEVGTRTTLNNIFPASFTATALLLATIAGSLFGRALGTVIAIEKFSREADA